MTAKAHIHICDNILIRYPQQLQHSCLENLLWDDNHPTDLDNSV